MGDDGTHSQRRPNITTTFDLVYDRKLDTALVTTPIRELMERVKSNTPTSEDAHFINLIKTLDFSNLDECQKNVNVVPLIWNMLRGRTKGGIVSRKAKNSTRWFPKALDVAMGCIRKQIGYMWESTKDISNKTVLDDLDGKSSQITSSPEIMFLSEFIREFTDLLDRLGKGNNISKDNKAHFYESDMLRLKIIWTRKFSYFNINGLKFICPKEVILMVHNKMCDIFSILLYLYMSSGTVFKDDAYDISLEFLDELSSLHCKYGETAFRIMKCLEAVVTGITLQECDSWRNDEFLNNIALEFLNDDNIDIKGEYIFELLKHAEIPLRHELSCFSKLMGHPIMVIEDGVETMKTHARAESDISAERVRDTIRAGIRRTIKSYILKHGKWPEVNVDPTIQLKPGMIVARARNLDPDSPEIVNKFGKLDDEDYEPFEFRPIGKFERLENVIPYLKDKAISLMRSDSVRAYLVDKDNRTMDRKNMRLLLYFLLNPMEKLDHQEYFNDYESSDELEEVIEYLVIRVVPKEKELKAIFRGFGCKTYFDRLRSMAQEETMMRHLDNYCDCQAMTLSELQIIKKLQAFRRIKDLYVNHEPIIIVIDASKWCTRQRDRAVGPYGKRVLDPLYRTTMFSKTMKAYEKTLFLVQDGEKTHSWDGQLGGIEGLNQDTWVEVYVSQIDAAMRKYKYPFHVLCKGDDLRVIVLVPKQDITPDKDLGYYKNLLVNHVSSELAHCGHKIKTEECYGSQVYLSFSKQCSVGDILLPQACRRIQKTYGANNAFLPFLDDYIGSTYSNAHSACSVSTNVIPSYLIATVWSVFYTESNYQLKKLHTDELIGLFLVPSMLGGFPIIYLHNMFVRAESDLFSPFIGLLQYLIRQSDPVAEVMKSFLMVTKMDTREAFEGLLKDPYSLPIRKPVGPSSHLKAQMFDAIKRICQNEMILEIIAECDDEKISYILDFFYSMKHWNPKVFSAIYSCLPPGLMDKFVMKFETGRSMIDLVVGRNRMAGLKLVKMLKKKESLLQTHRANKTRLGGAEDLDLTPYLVADSCPGKVADRIREILWEHTIEGITMPPLQHQILIGSESSLSDSEYCRKNHFAYYSHPANQVISKTSNLSWSAGPVRPFIGHKTKTGLHMSVAQFEERNAMIQSFRNLLDIRAFCSRSFINEYGETVSSNIGDLINLCFKYYTNQDLPDLQPFSSLYRSGTVHHHLRSVGFKEAIMPNTLSNIYTRLSGDTDTHTIITSVKGHYLYNFLHIFCYAINVISLPIIHSNSIEYPSNKYWAVTKECDYCNKLIVEHPLIGDVSILNKLQGISVLKIQKESDLAEIIVKESIAKLPPAIRQIVPRNIQELMEMNSETLQRALVEELLLTGYYEQKQLAQYWSGYMITDAGRAVRQDLSLPTKGKQFGRTELKNLQPRFLVEGIAHVVISEIMVDRAEVRLMEIRAHLHRTGTQELPWSGLITMLESSYKIGGMMTYIKETLQLTSDFPSMSNFSSKMMHISTYVVQCFLSVPTVKERLLISTFSSANMARRIASWIHGIFYHIYHNVYQPAFSTQDRNEVARFLDSWLVLCAHQDFNYWELESYKTQLENVQEFEINLLQCESYNPEKLLAFADDPTEWNCGIKWLLCEGFDEGFIIDHLAALSEDIGRQENALEHAYEREDRLLEYNGILIKFLTASDVSVGIRALESAHDRPLFLGRRDDLLEVELTIDRALELEQVTINLLLQDRAPTLPEVFVVEDPTPQLHALQLSDTFRVFYTSSSACNKLLEILFRLGIIKGNQRNLYALCLADGKGGFAYTLGKILRESVIEYSSLPDQKDRLDHLAFLAEECNSPQENKLNADYYQAGKGDLLDESYVNLLTSSRKCISIITVDAQTSSMNAQEKIQFAKNLMSIFMLTGAETSVAIIKVFASDVGIVSLILGTAYFHNIRSYIFKPSASRQNQEFYFVLVQTSAVPRTIHGFLHLTPESLVRIYTLHISPVLSRLANVSGSIENIQISLRRTPSWLKLGYDLHLPLTIQAATFHSLPLVRLVQEINFVQTGQKPVYSLMEYVRSSCVINRDNALNDMNNLRDIDTWHTNHDTQAHLFHLIYEILSYEGIIYCMTLNTIFAPNLVIQNNHSLNRYTDILNLLPERFCGKHEVRNWKQDKVLVRNREFEGLKHYIRGVRLGCSLLRYCRFKSGL